MEILCLLRELTPLSQSTRHSFPENGFPHTNGIRHMDPLEESSI